MTERARQDADPADGRARTRLRGRLGWLLLVVLAAAGYGVVASRSPAPPEHQPTGDVARAAQAIEALLAPTSGRDPIAALPADFTHVTGVVPDRLPAPDGTTRAVHVDGGCSTPWGDDDTRWDYSVGCKAHDLGYDLLRYASAKGEPLGAEPRRRLDEQLSRDMHAQCELNPRGSPGTCRTVASLYSAGLVANSWHQRWGPPRSEPIATWTVALLVVVVLLAVRVPAFARRRTGVPRGTADLSEAEGDRAGYLGFLRLVSLTGIVVAESVLAFAPLLSVPVAALWPLTWALQLVPLFFFAGGHSNLLAWRAAREAGTGYGGYLAGRVCWLIRPVLAFVTAWLVVPLSLDLLDAPDAAVAAVGRLVVQPLWLLGLYLLVVGATPVLHWLHERAPVAAPVAQTLTVVALGLFGSGTVAAHAGGIAAALLFGQLAFLYADGTLWRARPRVLVAAAVGASACLTVLTTVGGQPKLLIAEPAGTASFVPSALGVLLIGIAQVCLVALPRSAGVRAVARSTPARAVRFVRAAPMTVYLVYLCGMLVLAGLVGAAGLPITAVSWLARPSNVLALALLGVPTALAFLLFEWRTSADPGAGRADDGRGTRWDVLAAALGTGYVAVGVLGFAVTGFTREPPMLLGLPLDPMASLIHLLLGWYLLHSVRVGTASTPGPWLLAAVACVPPMITTVSGAGITVHGLTIAVAGVAAAACARQAPWLLRRSGAPRPVAESAGG
ncbi:phospholipase A2 [Actinokineospora sp.]|uniref:phospholipase A2 n=1 Tax=Actinokineospora sp. TaxID=1872133 RepID=UPI004037CB36